MNDESRSASDGAQGSAGDDQTLPARFIFVILLGLALVCVAGYFFLMKLIDVSREEDCVLAGRRNCAAITVPNGR
jgi:hypothetical protein